MHIAINVLPKMLFILSTISVDLNQNYFLLSEFSTPPVVRVILEKLLIGLVAAKQIVIFTNTI